MLLLANENIPLASVQALRAAGHDVLSITEHKPGITDAEVMAMARAQQRCIVTFDRDYGELIFVNRLPTQPAVFICASRHPALNPPRWLSKLYYRSLATNLQKGSS